jgi:hypothetical protein
MDTWLTHLAAPALFVLVPRARHERARAAAAPSDEERPP